MLQAVSSNFYFPLGINSTEETPSEKFLKLIETGYQFPSPFTSERTLNLANRHDLIALPKELRLVKGSLFLYKCTNLITLPQGLVVEGTLTLSDCISLTTLPTGLVVKGDLELEGCTNLVTLPEDLQVEGSISLRGCINMTTLPSWITKLSPLLNGNTRIIDLTGTGLSQATINRLINEIKMSPSSRTTFHFSREASTSKRIFTTLDKALEFWKKETNCSDLSVLSIEIQAEHLPSVLTFLSQLTVTAEYKNLKTRVVLAQRVIQAFNWMAKNTTIQGRALDIIYHGITTCDDRIISALDEIELMVNIHELENAVFSEEKLRQMGKSYLFLEMVNGKAGEHAKTLTWVDEVEVYLAFQIGLGDRFSLPLSTRKMIFKNYAQVTDEQLAQVGNVINQEYTEEKLDQFLLSWSPWIRHKRRISVPVYDELPSVELQVLEFGVEGQEDSKKLVLYKSKAYDYDFFSNWYIENGTDPLTREPIHLSELYRIKI
ncbi:MAG: NEL-type E3 ubiquitin ligase domain-containing protein [Rhabdochlamydiaceae bacterium]